MSKRKTTNDPSNSEAEHTVEATDESAPGDAAAAKAGDNQPDQSNENPEAFEADPHVHVPGNVGALGGPSQDDLNPAYAPPPAPDAKDSDSDGDE